MRIASLAFLLALAALPSPASAQQTGTNAERRIRQSREELERIRQERRTLEQRMADLQSNAHDLREELTNLESQAEATSRAVRSLESQLAAIDSEVGHATANLVRAEDELIVKRAILRQRLADIYKRGPLYEVEVLLSAASFGDLIARYKYLHLLALRDRALVRRVEELRNTIGRQRQLLVRLQNDLELNRSEKAGEELRLRTLEQQRQASLASVTRSARQTEQRLARISRDEERLTDVIASLETARRRAEAARPAEPRTPSIGSAPRATRKFDWPVNGTLIYQFGRVVNPNNTTTRWNGIGIAAPNGTPVKAIAAGRVAIAEPFGTYGLTVIIQHPGGDYSVYGSLSSASVTKGAIVNRGQTIGEVGAGDPDLPPHLHFELRPEGHAVDPLDWLFER